MEFNLTKIASVDTTRGMLGNLEVFAELDLETTFAKFTEEGSHEI